MTRWELAVTRHEVAIVDVWRTAPPGFVIVVDDSGVRGRARRTDVVAALRRGGAEVPALLLHEQPAGWHVVAIFFEDGEVGAEVFEPIEPIRDAIDRATYGVHAGAC